MKKFTIYILKGIWNTFLDIITIWVGAVGLLFFVYSFLLIIDPELPKVLAEIAKNVLLLLLEK